MLTATVTGNLGNDSELKFSASGQPFLRFNIASNYRVRGEDGSWSDAVEWVRGTVFGNRAESLAQHLKKGMRVVAQGRLEARPWVDSNENVRAGLELMVTEIDFQSAPNGQGGQQQQQARQQPQGGQRAASGQQRPQQRQQGGGRMNEWDAAHGPNDQDVPF